MDGHDGRVDCDESAAQHAALDGQIVLEAVDGGRDA